MGVCSINKVKNIAVRSALVAIAAIIIVSNSNHIAYADENTKEETTQMINQIFVKRNEALLRGDTDFIEAIYDKNTKYGIWAFEHEQKKMKYIQNWAEKQGVQFISITPTVLIRKLSTTGNKHRANVLCSTEYKYCYKDQPEVVNSSRIGTYHVINLTNDQGVWSITKEWYTDPFADSLNLDNLKYEDLKTYISSQPQRDLSNISERRKKAVEYGKMYCGAASDGKNNFKYNKKYRDYNPMGGDCANFASQMLHEGGKFKKNHAWNYDMGGATRAWVNADGFKNYMIGSGRASLIAYGSYEKVCKASYKLQPGDFVAYERKNDIVHISMVTGADSKGYSLVTCHNTDRNDVPWDLGWSDKRMKFYLVRVHY